MILSTIINLLATFQIIIFQTCGVTAIIHLGLGYNLAYTNLYLGNSPREISSIQYIQQKKNHNSRSKV